MTDRAEAFVDLSTMASGEVHVEEQLDLADGSVVQYLTARGCPADRLLASVPGADTDVFEVVSDRNGRLLLRLVSRNGGVMSTLERAGATTRRATAVDGAGRVVARLLPGVDPSAVIDAVVEAHPDAELVARRVRRLDGLSFAGSDLEELLRNRLTVRQWEVLVAAYRAGYFERPRERTGEEIATDLGISSATFSQHLRVAQRHLLSVVIDDVGVDPGR